MTTVQRCEPKSDSLNALEEFNGMNLHDSMKNLYDQDVDEITSIMCNYPALLLRKKSDMHPAGRTSYRFKKELRKQVMIIGKSAFGPGTGTPQVTAPPKVICTELDQKEVEDDADW